MVKTILFRHLFQGFVSDADLQRAVFSWDAGGSPAPAAGRGAPKKGRTTPLYLEGLKFTRFWGVRQSIYETAGNFYTSMSGEKGAKHKKTGPPA